ncbi:hypothetical protein [Cystobacter ferrugineus]|uniref:Uncharacterized protein n=1 Tax=Cystobacter ferrugineus TaxID=83449 RepID=A0A1L9AYD0_9BACT|nr:hypothetical protein [Cystobacter ferrugineus]OJH34913.1 hypothetical protein BON30_40725 [Cystobacter ferrugineus]
MRVPTRTALLEELDSLGHRARLERVATLGRQARGAPALLALMAELVAGDAHEATLAVVMAQASRDEPTVLRALTHPSRMVRGHAASFAAATLGDETLLQVLPELASVTRRRVLKGLGLARRTELAARLLPRVRAHHGDAEAALLLTALDAEEVRRLLPELAHALHAWATLVHRHPDVVLDFLRARITEAPVGARPGLISTWRLPLAELLHLRSDAVLALVRDHGTPGSVPALVKQELSLLSRKHPEQVFQLLTQPTARGELLHLVAYPGNTRALVNQLSSEQHQGLARVLAAHPHYLALFLKKVAPSKRAALYTHAFAGAPPTALDESLFSLLPHALRDSEAVRLLDRPEAREERSLRLSLLAFRTIEHSREPLKEAAFAHKAEGRARALQLLVRSTGLSRRGLTETLTHLACLKNEQDPVRGPVLQELSRVPASLFTSEHVPHLEALVTDVFQARDTSDSTWSALKALIFGLLRAHVTEPHSPVFRFALKGVERIHMQWGIGVIPNLHGLPRGAEHVIVAGLLPWLRAIEDEGDRHMHTLMVCDMLGLELTGNVDMLQPLLQTITRSDFWSHSDQAIKYWLVPRRSRDAHVRELLAREPSAITLYWVYQHLSRYRPEMLEPYLEGRPIEGIFGTGKSGWTPILWHTHSWSPRQQERYRDLLLRIANGEVHGERNWTPTRLLRQLVLLPVTTEKHLRPLLGSSDAATVEATLDALGRLDQPESALPLLLEHLEGDRAWVAMQAVSLVMDRVSPRTRAATLASLLTRDGLKVTVRKEVVRLLGSARDGPSLALLHQQWDSPRLHRDVRIAVGYAARKLLETSDSAWEMVETLARSPDEYVAGSVLDQRPELLPARLRPRYAGIVLQLARHPDVDVRRNALQALTAWAPGFEEQVAQLTAAYLQDLSVRAGWRDAVKVLVSVTRDGTGFEQVEACAAALASAPAPEEQDEEPMRDLPARLRLNALIRALLDQPRPVLLRLRPHLARLARVLASDLSLWPLAARLRVHPLGWDDAAAVADVVLGLMAETREDPLFAQMLASTVSASVESAGDECPPELLLDVASRLLAEAPLVALALVHVAGRRLHWRADAVRLLRALQQHPRPSVRAHAHSSLAE